MCTGTLLQVDEERIILAHCLPLLIYAPRSMGGKNGVDALHTAEKDVRTIHPLLVMLNQVVRLSVRTCPYPTRYCKSMHAYFF